MSAFTAALLPIIALIAIGFGLKRTAFLPEASWPGIERLTYFILLPTLLVGVLGDQSLGGTPWPTMLMVILGTLAVATVALLVYHKLQSGTSDATFTSIFQGGIRINTYITLAIAQGMYGVEGIALASVGCGFIIVLVNLLCISAFAVWGSASARGLKPFFREIFGNPLLIACAIGWTLSLTGIGIPEVAEGSLEIVGRAALPLGLLAVGAALKLDAIRGHAKPVAIASAVQFGLKPASTALFAGMLGLDGIAAAVLYIAFVTPTASSCYILAKQLGGDTETMASIITFETLLAFAVMPILIPLMLG